MEIKVFAVPVAMIHPQLQPPLVIVLTITIILCILCLKKATQGMALNPGVNGKRQHILGLTRHAA